jgi:hypothetical protein
MFNKKQISDRQLKLRFDPDLLQEGWTGNRYLLCDDGKWHLAYDIRKQLMVDVACCAGVTLVIQEEWSKHPICDECAEIQAARWGLGPRAKGR